MGGRRARRRFGPVLAAAMFGAALVPSGAADAAETPYISIGDASVIEGNSGKNVLFLPVTLSEPATSQVTVDVTVSAIDATPGRPTTPGADFDDRGGRTRTLVYKLRPNGTTPTAKFVAVRVFPDTEVEGDEQFKVTLSNPTGMGFLDGAETIEGIGTIVDDDESSGFTAAIGDATIHEGDAGKRSARFTVTLSEPALTDVSVGVTIVSGTATCGPAYYGAPRYPGTDCNDLNGVTRTLVIKAGRTFRPVNVGIFSDLDPESDETYSVVLSDPQGSGLSILSGHGTGTGTILDDDS